MMLRRETERRRWLPIVFFLLLMLLEQRIQVCGFGRRPTKVLRAPSFVFQFLFVQLDQVVEVRRLGLSAFEWSRRIRVRSDASIEIGL